MSDFTILVFMVSDFMTLDFMTSKKLKRSVFIGSLGFLLVCLGFFLFPYCKSKFKLQTTPKTLPVTEEKVAETTSSLSPFGKYTNPLYTPPQKLILPGHLAGKSVKTDFEEISLVEVKTDSTGQLEVPQDPKTGGWYYKSAKAGANGNVLINAHYDDTLGRPAAFYYLKFAKVGDTLVLVDLDGREFPYEITEIYYVGIYDEDRVKKLLDSKGASLTLVTCGGIWQPGMGTYSQRLVIKARLDTSVRAKIIKSH